MIDRGDGRGVVSSPWKGEVGAQRRVGVKAARFDRTPTKTARARKLRCQMTAAEARLWHRLRGGQIQGLSFRRQHPMGPYLLDFYCPALKLTIEVDGGQHGYASVQRADRRRAEWLAERGVAVLRFWNSDVLSNVDGVLEEIDRRAMRLMNATPTRSALPTDLPLAGGGKERVSGPVFGEIDR